MSVQIIWPVFNWLSAFLSPFKPIFEPVPISNNTRRLQIVVNMDCSSNTLLILLCNIREWVICKSSPGGPREREPEVTSSHFFLEGLREVEGIGLIEVASGQQREVCPGGPGIQVTIPSPPQDFRGLTAGWSSVGSPVCWVGSLLRTHSGFLS